MPPPISSTRSPGRRRVQFLVEPLPAKPRLVGVDVEQRHHLLRAILYMQAYGFNERRGRHGKPESGPEYVILDQAALQGVARYTATPADRTE